MKPELESIEPEPYEEKTYEVGLEGTEVFRASRNEALAWLWASRVEGAQCWINTRRDPGRVHAKDLDLSLFPKDKLILARIYSLFESAELDNCRTILQEMLSVFPHQVLREHEEDPRVAWSHYEIAGYAVELRIKSAFALRHKCHTYEVGMLSPEDYDSKEYHNRREALKDFCIRASRLYFDFYVQKEEGDPL